jgi:hypothetical protein
MTFPAGAIVNGSAFNDDIEWRVGRGDSLATNEDGKE